MAAGGIIVAAGFGVVSDAAGLMVSRYENESASVFLRKINSRADRFIKLKERFSHSLKIIAVGEFVDTRALDHKEEAVLVFIEYLQRLLGHNVNGRCDFRILYVFEIVGIELAVGFCRAVERLKLIKIGNVSPAAFFGIFLRGEGICAAPD